MQEGDLEVRRVGVVEPADDYLGLRHEVEQGPCFRG